MNIKLFPFAAFSFFLCLLSLNLPSTTADVFSYDCGNTGSYTANSTYESNLLALLPTLVSSGSVSGFAQNSKGQSPNIVNGLVLCRGDISKSECSSCLSIASQDIVQICVNNKDATVFYADCLLRYSNTLLVISPDNTNDFHFFYNTQDIPNVKLFDKLLNELLGKTAAAAYNSKKKFATGRVNFDKEFPYIYALMQCTPDMTTSQCKNCLGELIDPLPQFYEGKQGARTLGVRCNMRYEVYSFYEGKPTINLHSALTNATTLSGSPVLS